MLSKQGKWPCSPHKLLPSRRNRILGVHIFPLPVYCGVGRDFWLNQLVGEGPQPLDFQTFKLCYQRGISPSTPLAGTIRDWDTRAQQGLLFPDKKWSMESKPWSYTMMWPGGMTQHLDIPPLAEHQSLSGVIRRGKPGLTLLIDQCLRARSCVLFPRNFVESLLFLWKTILQRDLFYTS